MILAFTLIFCASCAFIVPHQQLPFSIITPNLLIGEEPAFTYTFQFYLSQISSLTDGNVFSVGFSEVATLVQPVSCSLTVASTVISLAPLTQAAGTNGLAQCSLYGLSSSININENTLIKFELRLSISTSFGYVKTVSLRITTGNDSNSVVLAESPFFTSAVRYAETNANYKKLAFVTSAVPSSTTRCGNEAKLCLGIYPGSAFNLDIKFTAYEKIEVQEMIILLEFSNNSFGSNITGQSSTIGNFSVTRYRDNALMLNFSQDIQTSQEVIIKLTGFQAPYYLGVAKSTLSFYWKNTFSRVSQIPLPDLTISPFPITFSQKTTNSDWQGIAHPEFFDIYENGSWPIKFIMDLPPLSSGGYLVIENVASQNSIFKFLASTCDFSEDLNGNRLLTNELGQRVACHSFPNSETTMNSAVFFRVGNSEKAQTISVTVWGVAVKCSSNDIFANPPIVNNVLFNSNQSKYKFTYKVYTKVDQSSPTPFSDSSLIAQSNEILMYGNCYGSVITHFSTFPSTDISPWNSDSRYVTNDNVLIKRDVLIYSEIHDWNITRKSTASKSINFIQETNITYLSEITTSQDIEFGALSNKFNYFPQTTIQGTLALQLSSDFLSNGTAPCSLNWYNNGQLEVQAQGSNFISSDTAKNYDQSQLINASGSNMQVTSIRDPSSFRQPIIIQSNQLTNDVDYTYGKSRFFRSSAIDLNLGFATNCLQLQAVVNVKSIYSYIDFTYIHKRSNVINRVGRFIKLFPSGQVFNNPNKNFFVNSNHKLIHSFSTVNENVCILSVDGSVLGSADNSYDSMNIHLQNLRLLEQDYSDMTSYYPSLNLVATTEFTSMIYPFTHRNDSISGQLNSPLKDCTAFSSNNFTLDDGFFCRCSSINPHPTCKIECNLNPYHPRCFCSTIRPHESCTVRCDLNVYHPYCNCSTSNPHATCPIDCTNKYQNFSLCNCLGESPRAECPINCMINLNHPNCQCDGTSPHNTCPVNCFKNPFHINCHCSTSEFDYTCGDVNCALYSDYPKCNCAGTYPNINCPINCALNPNHKLCKCDIKRLGYPHNTCPINCSVNPYHPLCYCLPEQNVNSIIPHISCNINCSFNSKHPSCNCGSFTPHQTCPIDCVANINHPNCHCNSTVYRPHPSCPVTNCNVAEAIRHPYCHCYNQNSGFAPSQTCNVNCMTNPNHPLCNCWLSSAIVNAACPINCALNANHPSCGCSGTSPHYTCPKNCSLNTNHPACECSYSLTNIFKDSNCLIDCTGAPNDSRCLCSSSTPHPSCPVNCASNFYHPKCNCWSQTPDISCWINCSINAAHPTCNCTLDLPHWTCPVLCNINNKHPRCNCSSYPNSNCNVDCQINAMHPACKCNSYNEIPHSTCTPHCNINDTHPNCGCNGNSPDISCPIDCSTNPLHPTCKCGSSSPHYTCTVNCSTNSSHPLCYCSSSTIIPNVNCSINCSLNEMHPSCNCRSSSPLISCPIDCTNKNINHPSCNCGTPNPHPTCPILCSTNSSHPSCMCDSNTPHFTCSVNCALNSYHPYCNCNDQHKIPHTSCPINCITYQNINICRCESRDPATRPHSTCAINCSHNDNHPTCSCSNIFWNNRHPTCYYDCSTVPNNPGCNCDSNSPNVLCSVNCSNNNHHPLCYCSSTTRIQSIYCPINCNVNSLHPSCHCNSNNPSIPPDVSCPLNCKQNSLHPSCKCGGNSPHSTCSVNCNTNPNNILCGCPGNLQNCSINCNVNPSHPYCFCNSTGIFSNVFCSMNCTTNPYHPNCNCYSTDPLLIPNSTCPIKCSDNDNHPSCSCLSTNILFTPHITCPLSCSKAPLHPLCKCSSITPDSTCPVDCKTNNNHPYCNCTSILNLTVYPISQYCNINCSLYSSHPSCNCDSRNSSIPPHVTCPNINCTNNPYHPSCNCLSNSPHSTCPISCTVNSFHPQCKCQSNTPHITCIMDCFNYPFHPSCNCNSVLILDINVNCPVNCLNNPNHPNCNCNSLDPLILPHATCIVNCAINQNNLNCNCDNIVGDAPHPTCPIDCIRNQYHPNCMCTSTSPHNTCEKNCPLNNYHPQCNCYNNSINVPDDSCPINCSMNKFHSSCKCDSNLPHFTCPINCLTTIYHSACNCNFTYPNLRVSQNCSPNCSNYPQHPYCNCDSLNPHITCTKNCQANYYHPSCNCFNIFTPNSNCPINCIYNSLHPNCNCNSNNPDPSCSINCASNSNHPYCHCDSTNLNIKPHITCSIDCSINSNHPSCNCSGSDPHSTCPINNCANPYHPLCYCFSLTSNPNSNCPKICDIYPNHPLCGCNGTNPDVNCFVNCTNNNYHPLCACNSASPHMTCPVNCNVNRNHYLCNCNSFDPHTTCDGNTCTSNIYHPACNCKSQTATPNSICPVKCDYNINHLSCNCGSQNPHETCPVDCIYNNYHPYCQCGTNFTHFTCPKDCSASSPKHPLCRCDSTTPDVSCPMNCSINPYHPNCHCDGLSGSVNSQCEVNCSLVISHPSCACGSNSPDISCPLKCDLYPYHPLCGCYFNTQFRFLLGLQYAPNSDCPIDCPNYPYHPSCNCTSNLAHSSCRLNCNTYPYQPYCNCFSTTLVPNSNCPVNCSINPYHPSCNCNTTSANITCIRDCINNPQSSLCACSSSTPHYSCAINCSLNINHPACNCNTSSSHSTCPLDCNARPYMNGCNCYSLINTPDQNCPINCSTNDKHPLCRCITSTPHSTCPVYCNFNDYHELCHCTSTVDNPAPHATCTMFCNLYPYHPLCQCDVLVAGKPHSTCPMNCAINMYHPSCNCQSFTLIPDSACPLDCSNYPLHPLCKCNSNDSSLINRECTINCANNPNHPDCNCTALSSALVAPHNSCPINCALYSHHPQCNCLGIDPHPTCVKDCSINYNHPYCYCFNVNALQTADISCPINCQANSTHPLCNCNSIDPLVKPNITCSINCLINSNHPMCNCDGSLNFQSHYTCPINCALNPKHYACHCLTWTPHITCPVDCAHNINHPYCNCNDPSSLPDINCPINCAYNSRHPSCNCSSTKIIPHITCIIDCSNNPTHPNCRCNSTNIVRPHSTCPINCTINNFHPNCSCDGMFPHLTCVMNCKQNSYHPLCNCYVASDLPNFDCPINCAFNSLHPKCKCDSLVKGVPHFTCPRNCITNPYHPACGCSWSFNPHPTCVPDCYANPFHYLCNCLGLNPHSTCPVNCFYNSNHASCGCNSISPHHTCPESSDCIINPFDKGCQCEYVDYTKRSSCSVKQGIYSVMKTLQSKKRKAINNLYTYFGSKLSITNIKGGSITTRDLLVQRNIILPVICPAKGNERSFINPSISIYSYNSANGISTGLKYATTTLNSQDNRVTVSSFLTNSLDFSSRSITPNYNLKYSNYYTNDATDAAKWLIYADTSRNCQSTAALLSSEIGLQSSITLKSTDSAYYTSSRFFYLNNIRFNSFVYSTLNLAQQNIPTDSSAFYTGIARPDINSLSSSKYSFNCYEDNNGNTNAFINKVDTPEIASIIKTPWDVTLSKSANSPTLYQQDKSFSVDLTIKVPSQLTLSGTIVLNTNLVNSSSLCALDNGNNAFSTQCSINSLSISCNYMLSSSPQLLTNLKICCQNVILDKSQVNILKSSNIIGSGILFSNLESDILLDLTPNLINEATLATLLPVIKGYTFSQVNHANGLGSIFITIDLIKPTFPNQRILITGKFDNILIATDIPECMFAYNSNATTNFIVNSSSLEDLLVDKCQILRNIATSTTQIRLSNKNKIYKCGMKYSSIVVVRLSPIKVNNLQSLSTSYNIVSSIGNFDDNTSYVSANPSTLLFPSFIFSTLTNPVSITSLCDVISMSPAILGHSSTITFNFDLTNVSTTALINEFSIFIRSSLYDRNDNLVCLIDDVNAPCRLKESGFLNISLTSGVLNLSKHTVIVRNIAAGPNGPHVFDCSANTYDFNADVRENVVIGRGINNFKILVPTNYGLILNNNVSINKDGTKMYPRTTTTINLDFVIDNTQLYHTISPDFIPAASSYPALLVELPAEYPIDYIKSSAITANVVLVPYSEEDKEIIYKIKGVNADGRRILIIFDETKISVPMSAVLTVALGNVLTPYTEVQTGIFRISLINDYLNPTLVYTNNNNLNAFSPNPQEPYGLFTRGYMYSYPDVNSQATLQAIDINDNGIANLISLNQGQYKQLIASFKSTVFPVDYQGIIEPDANSIFKIIGTNAILTNIKPVSQFYLGVPCGIMPGTYFITFKPQTDSNIIPVGPIKVNVTTLTSGYGTIKFGLLQSNPSNAGTYSMSAGGKFSLFIVSNSIPFDPIKFLTTLSPDASPKSYIENGSSITDTNYSSFNFIISDSSVKVPQKLTFSTSNKCYRFNDSLDQTALLTFVPDSQLATVINIDLASTITYNNNISLDNAFSINFKTIPSTSIYCSLFCASVNGPTTAQMLARTTLKNTPTSQDIYYKFISEGTITHTFYNLRRGQAFKLKCVLANWGITPTTIEIILDKIPSKIVAIAGSTSQTVLEYKTLVTADLIQPTIINLSTQSVLSASITQALVRSLQAKYQDKGYLFSDSNNTVVKGVTRSTQSACFDESNNTNQAGGLRFLQSSTDTSTILVTSASTTNTSNGYYLIVEEDYSASESLAANISTIVNTVSNKDNLNSLISSYTTDRVNESPVIKSYKDYILDNNLLKIPSTNGLIFTAPNTILQISYPLNSSNSLKCYWKTTSQTISQLTSDIVKSCDGQSSSTSTCGAFTLTGSTSQVALPTGNLPVGVYNFYVYCSSDIPFTKYYLLKSVGSLEYKSASSSSVTSASSTTAKSQGLQVMDFMLAIFLIIALLA